MKTVLFIFLLELTFLNSLFSQEQVKKFVNVILVYPPKEIPYVEFDSTYQTDGSDVVLLSIIDTVTMAVSFNLEHKIEGVTYRKQGGVITSAVIYLEIEDLEAGDLEAARDWLNDIGVDWQIVNNTWMKGKAKSHPGYWGYMLLKYF